MATSIFNDVIAVTGSVAKSLDSAVKISDEAVAFLKENQIYERQLLDILEAGGDPKSIKQWDRRIQTAASRQSSKVKDFLSSITFKTYALNKAKLAQFQNNLLSQFESTILNAEDLYKQIPDTLTGEQTAALRKTVDTAVRKQEQLIDKIKEQNGWTDKQAQQQWILFNTQRNAPIKTASNVKLHTGGINISDIKVGDGATLNINIGSTGPTPTGTTGPTPTGTTGPTPTGAAGPTPAGAAGPTPAGAAGPTPTGTTGPTPTGTTGPTPTGTTGPTPTGTTGPTPTGTTGPTPTGTTGPTPAGAAGPTPTATTSPKPISVARTIKLPKQHLGGIRGFNWMKFSMRFRIGSGNKLPIPTHINPFPVKSLRPRALHVLQPVVKNLNARLLKITTKVGGKDVPLHEAITKLNDDIVKLSQGTDAAKNIEDVKDKIDEFSKIHKDALLEFNKEVEILKKHIVDNYKTNFDLTGKDITRRGHDFMKDHQKALLEMLDDISESTLQATKGASGEYGQEILGNFKRIISTDPTDALWTFESVNGSLGGLSRLNHFTVKARITHTGQWTDGTIAPNYVREEAARELNEGVNPFYLRYKKPHKQADYIKDPEGKRYNLELIGQKFMEEADAGKFDVSEYSKLGTFFSFIKHYDNKGQMHEFMWVLNKAATNGQPETGVFKPLVPTEQMFDDFVANDILTHGKKSMWETPEGKIYRDKISKVLELAHQGDGGVKKQGWMPFKLQGRWFRVNRYTQHTASAAEDQDWTWRYGAEPLRWDKWRPRGKMALPGENWWYDYIWNHKLPKIRDKFFGAYDRVAPDKMDAGRPVRDYGNSETQWFHRDKEGNPTGHFGHIVNRFLWQKGTIGLAKGAKWGIIPYPTRAGWVAIAGGGLWGLGAGIDRWGPEGAPEWSPARKLLGNTLLFSNEFFITDFGQNMTTIATFPARKIIDGLNAVIPGDKDYVPDPVESTMGILDFVTPGLDLPNSPDTVIDINPLNARHPEKNILTKTYTTQKETILAGITTAAAGARDRIEKQREKLDEQKNAIDEKIEYYTNGDGKDDADAAAQLEYYENAKTQLETELQPYYDKLTTIENDITTQETAAQQKVEDLGTDINNAEKRKDLDALTANLTALGTTPLPGLPDINTSIETLESDINTAQETLQDQLENGETLETEGPSDDSVVDDDDDDPKADRGTQQQQQAPATPELVIFNAIEKSATAIRGYAEKANFDLSRIQMMADDLEADFNNPDLTAGEKKAVTDFLVTLKKDLRNPEYAQIIHTLDASAIEAEKLREYAKKLTKAIEATPDGGTLIDPDPSIDPEDALRFISTTGSNTLTKDQGLAKLKQTQDTLAQIQAHTEAQLDQIFYESKKALRDHEINENLKDAVLKMSGGSENGFLYQMVVGKNGAPSVIEGWWGAGVGTFKKLTNGWKDMKDRARTPGEKLWFNGLETGATALAGLWAINRINGWFFGGKMNGAVKWGLMLSVIAFALHRSGMLGDEMANNNPSRWYSQNDNNFKFEIPDSPIGNPDDLTDGSDFETPIYDQNRNLQKTITIPNEDNTTTQRPEEYTLWRTDGNGSVYPDSSVGAVGMGNNENIPEGYTFVESLASSSDTSGTGGHHYTHYPENASYNAGLPR